MKRALAIALAVFAVLVVGTTATGGVQALITGANIKDGSIGSNDIKPGAIQSHDIQNGTIVQHDLSNSLFTQLHGAKGAEGAKGDVGTVGPAGHKGDKGDKGEAGISGLQVDGPYPGAGNTPLHYGDIVAQSTAKWSADPALLQRSWVMCKPGKLALGGGFGQNEPYSDQFVVVTSTPLVVNDQGVLYPPDTLVNDQGSLLAPNGWLVEGYNKSSQEMIVRPWVICANVNS